MPSREYQIAQAARDLLAANTSAVAVEITPWWTDVEQGDTDLPRIKLDYVVSTQGKARDDLIEDVILTVTYQAVIATESGWRLQGDALSEELRTALPPPAGLVMRGWPDFVHEVMPMDRRVAIARTRSSIVEAVARYRVRFTNATGA